MANKLFGLPKPQAQLSKNGFDYSWRFLHSSKIGEIRPVACIETVPDEDFTFSIDEFTRSQPMTNAPFARMRRHFEAFFVPISPQLWQFFNQFKAERPDPVSNQAINNVRFISEDRCPCVNLRTVAILLHQLYVAERENFDDGQYYDVVGMSRAYGAVRLLNDLGYGDLSFVLSSGNTEQMFDSLMSEGSFLNYYVNVWPLLAYQKVWYDVYRNSVYDNDFPNLPYNVDFMSGLSDVQRADILVQGDAVESWFIKEVLQMRYHQYKKDLFTGCYPSPQFGSVSTVEWDSNIVNQSNDNRNLNAAVQSSLLQNGNQLYKGSAYSEAGATWNITGLDVYSIKQAEMLQAWREKLMRAGSRTRDIFNAQYGTVPRYDLDNHPDFIGSVSEDIINDVVTQTSSGGSNSFGDDTDLGTLGASGVGKTDNKVFKYHTRDFGIIIVMAYILPEMDYYSFNTLKERTHLERYDYFTPQFQNLGFVPVTAKEISVLRSRVGTSDDVVTSEYMNDLEPISNNNGVVGYAPSYYEYKQRRDVVGIGFQPRLYLNALSSGPRVAMNPAPFGDMVMPQVGTFFFDEDVMPLSRFYVSPRVADSIFYLAATDNPVTDPFQHEFRFSCTRVNTCSRLGLPQW